MLFNRPLSLATSHSYLALDIVHGEEEQLIRQHLEEFGDV